MAKFTYVFLIAALCVAGSLQATPFRQCSKNPPPTDLRIEGCSKMPCALKRGTEMKSEWDFVAQNDVSNLKVIAIAKTALLNVNYPLPQIHPCDNLKGASCPMTKNTKATYSMVFPIKNGFPPIQLSLEMSLVDENNNVQACYEIDAVVV